MQFSPRQFPAKKVLFFILLGSLCFALLPLAVRYTHSYFFERELFFGNPLPGLGDRLVIRNDSHGKGYFGASRNGSRSHKGVDLLATEGSLIAASKSGRVLFAGEAKGYGLHVEIGHPDGSATAYSHLSQIRVQRGQWLWKGDAVGHTGRTGNAISPYIRPHLHFEIRKAGDAINPVSVLDPGVVVS